MAALLLSGCDQDRPETGEGIVSLSPAITETMFAIGAGDQLVARTQFDRVPPESLDLPAVGSAFTPDFERIASMNPRLVLTDASASGQATQLAAIAPTRSMPWSTVDDIIASTRALGEISGRTDAADSLADALDAQLRVDPVRQGPTILLVLDAGEESNQWWYLPRNSVLGQALTAAGGRHVVDRDVTGAAVVSPEQLLAMDPDAIVMVTDQGTSAEARSRLSNQLGALEPLAAVRTNQLGAVSGPGFLQPGPSTLKVVDALRVELARLKSAD